MGELISYEERRIIPKGAKPSSPKNLEKYLFKETIKNLKILNKVPKQEINKIPHVLYPGCGADILNPLLYLKIIFPKNKQFKLTFVDIHNKQGLIETILDDVNIPFNKNHNKLTFYYEDIKIDFQFINNDIFNIIEKSSNFDIYFEKAFRIMKDTDLNYENKVIKKLNKKGILISDSGYKNKNLKKIKISKRISAYNEMIMATKS